MDPTAHLPFPNGSDDLASRDLVEIDAAIALVARGLANRVCLVSLARPKDVAALALAHAQAARVAFHLHHTDGGAVAVTLGPRIREALLGQRNMLVANVPCRRDV